jgi:hypothetical protein
LGLPGAGRAEADAVGGELEAVAVEVVAVGHLEADFDLVVDQPRAGAEGLGRQRLVGSVAGQGQQAEQGGEEEGEGRGGRCGSWPAV